MATRAPIDERFFAKVDAHGVCWEWTAATAKNGYGVFNRGAGAGTALAHRWCYEFLVGPIPDGLQLDHVCRNRRCVNPDHLEPVSQRENLLRGYSRMAQNARKTCCPQCHGPYSQQIVKGVVVGRICKPCQCASQLRKYHASKVA
jgi:hypothetical protein